MRTAGEQNGMEAVLAKRETGVLADTLEKPGAGSEWLKEFNDRNDSRYGNFSDTQIEDMYYTLLDRMQIAAENKNHKKAFAEAVLSLPLIRRFIQSQYAKYNGFYIKGIPAIDFCLEYCASMGLTGILGNIADIIKGQPELSFIYSDDLEQFRELSVLSRNIRRILRNNPEIKQDALQNYLPETGTRHITRAVHYMEEFGLIERAMEGTTCTLKLAAATSSRDTSSSCSPGTCRD